MTDHHRLKKYFENQVKIIIRLEPEVSRKLSGKGVHDLRVAIRRVQAALWLFHHSSAHLQFKKINRYFHKLQRVLGSVRELDVAIIDASHYGIDPSQLDYSHLIEMRKIAQTQLAKSLGEKGRKRLAQQIASAKKKMNTRKPVLLNQANAKLKSNLTSHFKHQIRSQKKLHQLRIATKKCRYALEAMGKGVTPLKRLQEVLGEANDLDFLQEFTIKNVKLKTLQKSLNHKAIRLVKKMRDQNALSKLARSVQID